MNPGDLIPLGIGLALLIVPVVILRGLYREQRRAMEERKRG